MAEERQEEKQETPGWERKATLVVFAMAVAAFVYIGYGYYTQRTFNGLMAELLSGDEKASAQAAEKLAATDDALPYLTDALINRASPEERELAARTILRRLEAKRSEQTAAGGEEQMQVRLRSGLNLEAVSRALQDESPAVRSAVLAIVERVGTSQNYQRNRLEEMGQFEGMLKKLEGADAAERQAAAEGLRAAEVRALPYLVGVVFSPDGEFRLRGLEILRATVQDVLKGSNQRRIVTLLGRRRCGLLLREMARLGESDRSIITDILNVSGRVEPEFFTEFLKSYASLDDAAKRGLLTERIEYLEIKEKLRGAPGPEGEQIEKLHGDTGEGK